MSLGERIAERLRALGLTQSELARRAGVPQTTMNGLIRGSYRTTPHLIRIARELATTPAYLMGEVCEPEATYPSASLTSEEVDWLSLFRNLCKADRDLLRAVAKRIIAEEKCSTSAECKDGDEE